MEQELLTELKQNVSIHKADFITARNNYFMALAINETNNDIGLKAKTTVLKENNLLNF